MPKKLYIKNDATLSVTSFQTVEKPLSLIKMGSQGRSPRQGLGAVAPVKSPFPGERGQGDRGSELEVCFKNILFLQSEG